MLELLENKNKNEFIRYQVLRRMIVYIASQNDIKVSDELFIEIIKKIYDKEYGMKADNIEKKIYLFCNDMIENYLVEKRITVAFNIEKYNFSSELKQFLIEEKDNLENIMHYYLNKKSTYGNFVTIYSNEYFSIRELSRKKCKGEKLYSEVEDGIGIRMLFQGKMLYKNGALLKNGEYLIRDLSKPIDEIVILSDDIHGVTLNLTEKFIKKFNVKKPEHIINMKISKFQINLLDLLDIDTLKYETLMLFETIILLLKFHHLIDEECETITEFLNYNEISIVEIAEEVKKNIRCNIEDIEEKVLKKFDISTFKLNDIIYDISRTTFRKYVLEMKMHYIVDFYINSELKLEEVLNHYNIENINVFRYNLKKFSNLGVKDLQMMKKEVEGYQTSAS